MRNRLVCLLALSIIVALHVMTQDSDAAVKTQETTAPRYLQGRVVFAAPGKPSKPAEGLEVALAEAGDKTHTKAHGKFRLRLRDRFGSGKPLTLLIDQEGWQIEHPLEGELYVPEDLEGEVINVQLRPLGAKEFLSEEHVQRMLEKAVTQAKETVNPAQETQKMDLTGPIQEWAKKYGLGFQDVQTAIREWAATITINEKNTEEDLHKNGLKELAEENFGKAIEYFDHSAQSKAKRLQKTREELKRHQEALSRLTEETVKEFRLAGDTAYNNYEFEKALEEYGKARENIEREGFPELWTQVQMDIAGANWAIGIRTEGPAVHEHLHRAKQAYVEAAKGYEELGDTTGRAAAQGGLGTALSQQGIRTGGEEGQQLLAQAVAAYRAALEVRTKESLAPQWAQTHNNLAEAALALEDWEQVVVSYTNVLELYPDYQDAYLNMNGVLHEKLFRFSDSFSLSQHWLATHQDDESAKMNFAESHLTTGHLAEAGQQLSSLLAQPDLDVQYMIPLKLLNLVSLVGQNKMASVSGQLSEIGTSLGTQPEDFTLGWSFEGTKHFIGQDEAFATSREWLLELLGAFSGTTRDAMLAAVEAANATLVVPPSP